MTKRVQWVGHISAAANNFIGRQREITVDVTTNELRVHDGSTPGGHRILNKLQNDDLYHPKDDNDFATPVTVDVINEHTGNAGVTVEGVLIKDGLVDGIDVSNLGASVVGLDADFDAYVTSNNAALAALDAAAAKKAANLSDMANAATAFGNIKQAATTGATGVAEIATRSEVDAATDAARYVTPEQLGFVVPRGYIAGLGTEQNSLSPDTSITVHPGICRSDDNTANIKLTADMTKFVDTAWSVGNNGGGLDTGAFGNSPYHLFVIYNPTTQAVDWLISLSATAPTMPSGFTKKRRIFSFKVLAGAIVDYLQYGDLVRTANASITTGTTAFALALVSFAAGIPTGINVFPLVHCRILVGVSTNLQFQLNNAENGFGVSCVHAVTGAGDGTDNQTVIIQPIFRTDTSARLQYARVIAAGSATTWDIDTVGWIDRRGQDD